MLIKKSLVIILSILVITGITFAHPGRTASDGCHYCRTNCDSRGEARNQRHCHNGGTSRTSSSSYQPATVNTRILTCDPGQCKFNGNCRNKPANASCTIGSTSDAWACNAGYYESNNTCVKKIEENYTKPKTEQKTKVNNASILGTSSTSKTDKQRDAECDSKYPGTWYSNIYNACVCSGKDPRSRNKETRSCPTANTSTSSSNQKKIALATAQTTSSSNSESSTRWIWVLVFFGGRYIYQQIKNK